MAMVMVVFCCCWALVIQSALAADGNSQFLDDINQYRISLSLPEFTSNAGAACVAQQIAASYKGTKCSNSTGTATVSGEEPQLSESMLSKCNLQLVNVKDGFLGPTCVPDGTSAASAPKLAAESVTMSQAYTVYVNDSKYVSAGVGSVDNQWYVLALATNASGGNYVNQDLDPSSHAFALSVRFAPISVLAYFVSAFILG
ncbi:hypothetical protein M758_5G051400 [Ceratodon purpureus]|uniref:Uncharacterized GPI-anchored protein At5g19230-like domain-containing protein n=1 Tax=Ceratodon purpureus TaxID=3225 RepID=A0A8T0HY32_CERPU|nr:hypothetical protein KC19_5G052100 [Ceratodon purpureus]KAG0615565.1 hypothetical protein M758_5G051400 [Ceratodon purpureus]